MRITHEDEEFREEVMRREEDIRRRYSGIDGAGTVETHQ